MSERTLERLIRECLERPTSEKFEEILAIVRSFSTHNDANAVTLDLFLRLINKPTRITLDRKISNLDRKLLQYRSPTSVRDASLALAETTVSEERVSLKLQLERLCETLPSVIVSGILHLIAYPGDTRLLRHVYSLFDVTYIILQVRALMQHDEKHAITQIEKIDHLAFRALLLAHLYNKHPHLLSLLYLFGDSAKLMEFCAVMGGTTLSVPTIAEVLHLVNFVKEDLTDETLPDDVYLLRDEQFMQEFSENFPPIPDDLATNITSLFLTLLRDLINNYRDFCAKTLETRTYSVEEIQRLSDLLDTKFETQLKLFTRLDEILGNKKINTHAT